MDIVVSGEATNICWQTLGKVSLVLTEQHGIFTEKKNIFCGCLVQKKLYEKCQVQ